MRQGRVCGGVRPEKTICSAQSAINAPGCRLELILAAYKVTFYGPLVVLVGGGGCKGVSIKVLLL